MTNRPLAPRHLAVTWIAIIALIFMVVPVTAEDFSESDYATWAAKVPAQNINLVATINEIRFNNIEKYHSLESVTLIYPNAVRMRKSTDQTTFIAKIGADEVGRGTLLVNQNYHSDGTYKSAVISADFDEWDIKSYSGSQRVSLSIDTSNGFEFFTRAGDPYAYLNKTRPITEPDGVLFVAWQDGNPGYPYYYGGAMSVYGRYNWALSFNYDDGFAYIDRHGYPSYVSICDSAVPELEYYAKTSGSDEIVDCMKAASINVLIKSGKGTIYNRVYTLDDPSATSRVMVHIIAQDARNENLLLNAAVEVRDQNDTVVATGSTSPDGWMVFEYDLPALLADEDFQRYYTVSVSLDGWTQKVTNYKFYPAFIPRSGDWIRVEMVPDAAGPADPGKTYLMFFVRDIHSTPLLRASIEIDGNYWHTNAAGHVAIEVPKNSTTAYTVRKTGHVSISGSAVVGAEGSYVVNIALGPALPDLTPYPTTPTPTDPGATPTPDRRSNEEKGQAVIDMIADNAEGIGALALICLIMGLLKLMVKW